jgi:ADP-dependent NAD(P)H-hydrate dehydratase / NAD(P)H-hydrate epimerase
MKIVTAADMREIDRVTTERFGMPSRMLMENAGSAVAEFALAMDSSAKSFGVICGKGNNGGDGFVVARKLDEAGKQVRVLLLAEPQELQGDAAENYKRLPLKATTATTSEELNGVSAKQVFQSDVLIDGILGSGFRPPVRGLYAQAIEKINLTGLPVIAIDVPSGADSDLMGEQTGAVAHADAIVTFTAPRLAHVFGNLTLGPILVAPIGSPPEVIQSSLHLNLITTKDIVPLLAPRPRDSNKGMYGHVLVVGGSRGKAGAAAMAGFSALRAGTGLVTVATARSVLPTVAGFHPELMTEPLEETVDGAISLRALERIEQLSEKKSVLAIGPGISRDEESAEAARKLVAETDLAIVLDADGLNAFEGRAEAFNRSQRKSRILVLTPHPGEMSRLTGLSIKAIQRDRVNVARNFAKEHGVILALKGDRTVVANPDGEAWINPTGNPGMATGGTGDILTGIVAGLLAQNLERSFEAALAAVYLHGLAGDIARDQFGEHSLVATDLVTALADAFRQVRAAAAENQVKIGE